MSEKNNSTMIPQWAIIVMALGGGGAGVSALGIQSSTEPVATRAEVQKLEASVDKLADLVVELKIEVRSAHPKR